mmetsp:Transcript_37231/g.98516  ORF Transcript_37231/g.98516 Transcript_37231/m.98516 type:complete len:115 (-) Transcript_37231:565-909(-)
MSTTSPLKDFGDKVVKGTAEALDNAGVATGKAFEATGDALSVATENTGRFFVEAGENIGRAAENSRKSVVKAFGGEPTEPEPVVVAKDTDFFTKLFGAFCIPCKDAAEPKMIKA